VTHHVAINLPAGPPHDIHHWRHLIITGHRWRALLASLPKVPDGSLHWCPSLVTFTTVQHAPTRALGNATERPLLAACGDFFIELLWLHGVGVPSSLDRGRRVRDFERLVVRAATYKLAGAQYGIDPERSTPIRCWEYAYQRQLQACAAIRP